MKASTFDVFFASVPLGDMVSPSNMQSSLLFIYANYF